jgi:hypothetical protein
MNLKFAKIRLGSSQTRRAELESDQNTKQAEMRGPEILSPFRSFAKEDIPKSILRSEGFDSEVS